MKRAGALVLVALVLTGCFGGSKSERVIRWIPQRPAPARMRPLAAPCRAAQLRASLGLQGATGNLLGAIELRNVGRQPCALLGLPSVGFEGGGARAARWTVHEMPPPDSVSFQRVPASSLRAFRPGEEADVVLRWSNWCGPGSAAGGRSSGQPPDFVALRLPKQGGEFRLVSDVGRVTPPCEDPAEPSSLGFTRFLPVEPRPSSRAPLAASILGTAHAKGRAEPRLPVVAGKPFRYRVALTNVSRRPFRFGNCPVYAEGLGHVPGPERYVLNCRPVGTIDPGEGVIFEMVLPVPADARAGNEGLTWELAPVPFASAGVVVRR